MAKARISNGVCLETHLLKLRDRYLDVFSGPSLILCVFACKKRVVESNHLRTEVCVQLPKPFGPCWKKRNLRKCSIQDDLEASQIATETEMLLVNGLVLLSSIAATKADVQSLAEGLQVELQGHGIVVLPRWARVRIMGKVMQSMATR